MMTKEELLNLKEQILIHDIYKISWDKIVEVINFALQTNDTLIFRIRQIEQLQKQVLQLEGLSTIQAQALLNQSETINGRNLGRTHT